MTCLGRPPSLGPVAARCMWQAMARNDTTSLPASTRQWVEGCHVGHLRNRLHSTCNCVGNATVSKVPGYLRPLVLDARRTRAHVLCPRAAADRFLFSPERGSAWDLFQSADVICHEMAHQWFGNIVTAADWGQLVVNEGVASFVENHCVAAALQAVLAPAAPAAGARAATARHTWPSSRAVHL